MSGGCNIDSLPALVVPGLYLGMPKLEGAGPDLKDRGPDYMALLGRPDTPQ